MALGESLNNDKTWALSGKVNLPPLSISARSHIVRRSWIALSLLPFDQAAVALLNLCTMNLSSAHWRKWLLDIWGPPSVAMMEK